MCVDGIHNHHSTNPQRFRGIRTVVADRSDHPSHHPEAEEVLIVSGTDAVEFVCDDGLSLTFPRDALTDAVAQSSERDA